MKRNLIKFMATLIGATILLSGCSIGSKEEKEHIPGRTGYRETLCTIEPELDNVYTSISDIKYSDGSYRVLVKYASINTGTTKSIKLCTINSEGVVTDSIDIEDPSYFDYRFAGDRIICRDFTSVKFFSCEDGSFINEVNNLPNNTNDIASFKDGYVTKGMGTIAYFDTDGNELGRVENESLQMIPECSVFEQNEKTYAYVENGPISSFYEIDFNTGTCSLAANAQDLGHQFYEYHGQYVFDDIGGLEVNLEGGESEYFVEWFNTDKKPVPYDTGNTDVYTVLDSDRFVITSRALSEEALIRIYEYDPSIDYSDRIILTVGGLYVDDFGLRQAIYEYNRSQDVYRIRPEHYVFEGDYSSSAMSNYLTELISQFSNGDAPDIFFGNTFDYEYFGRNGMVIDMLPYLEASDVFNPDDLYPSVRNLMCHDGVCYQIFYGFAIRGYFSRSDMNISTDMTYTEMFNLAEDSTAIMGPVYSRNIAAYIIDSSFDDFIDENGNFTLTYDEVQDIVELAINIGLPNSAPYEFIDNTWLSTGDLLLTNEYINDVAIYANLCDQIGDIAQFVGHPSVNGSAHLINPIGNAAVSSSTEYPQACVDFLTYLFTDDVQRGSENPFIPVNQRMNEEFINYAMDESLHGTNPLYDVRIEHHSEVTPEIAEAFVEAINSADTLEVYDETIYSIISEEISAYETQGKTPQMIADSLYNRLNLYINENY